MRLSIFSCSLVFWGVCLTWIALFHRVGRLYLEALWVLYMLWELILGHLPACQYYLWGCNFSSQVLVLSSLLVFNFHMAIWIQFLFYVLPFVFWEIFNTFNIINIFSMYTSIFFLHSTFWSLINPELCYNGVRWRFNSIFSNNISPSSIDWTIYHVNTDPYDHRSVLHLGTSLFPSSLFWFFDQFVY